MVYFEIINQSLLREEDNAQIIQSTSGVEGYAMSKIDSNSSKIALFKFNYEIQSGEDVKFVFGSTEIREKFIEIPLSQSKNSFLIVALLEQANRYLLHTFFFWELYSVHHQYQIS